MATCHTRKLSFPTIRESLNRENLIFSNSRKFSPTKDSRYTVLQKGVNRPPPFNFHSGCSPPASYTHNTKLIQNMVLLPCFLMHVTVLTSKMHTNNLSIPRLALLTRIDASQLIKTCLSQNSEAYRCSHEAAQMNSWFKQRAHTHTTKYAHSLVSYKDFLFTIYVFMS